MAPVLDFAAIFEGSPNPYMVLDRELRYVAANAAYCAVTARRREELIGRRIFEMFPHDPHDPDNANARRLLDSFERVLRSGQPDVLPLIHYRITVTRDGRPVEEDHYWSATHTPLFDDEGRVAYVLQHTTDVTELTRAHASATASASAPSSDAAGIIGRAEVVQQRNLELGETLRTLRSLFEQAPGFFAFLRGPEHVFEMANAAYERLVGGRALVGRTVRAALPEIEPAYFALLDRVYATGKPFVGRAMQVRIGGEDAFVDFVYQPIVDDDGRTVGIFVQGSDITPQVRAEGERERLSRTLQAAFARAPVGIAIVRGPRSTVELVNATACALIGRPEQELTGRPLLEVLDEPRVTEVLDAVRRRGEPWAGRRLRTRLPRGAGGARQEVWFDLACEPMPESDSVLVVGSEVTAEVRAHERMRAAQAELEAIFESFPEALFVGDAEGVKRANHAARDVLGYPTLGDVTRAPAALAAELAPRRADTGAPLASHDMPFARALRGLTTRLEVILRHARTGDDVTVFASGAPVRVGEEVTGAVVTVLDVTEQRRVATEALQLARVLDETRDFVGIADMSLRPVFVNEAGLRLVGLADRAAASALPVLDYFVERQRQRVIDEVVPAALRDGYWEGELLFQQQQTGEEIPVLYSIFPLRDRAGTTTALATITRDLRAQKAAEAERARLLEAEQAARAEAERANQLKDQFLATISHELRTPLTAVLGWIQMLRAGMVAAGTRERALDTIDRNARVQAKLIDDLLDVSRIVSGKLALEMEPVDLAAVAAAAVETVRPMAHDAGVTLEAVLESSGVVTGDARRLQQVVWNLLANGVKFTPRGGRVSLRIARRGDQVEITVSDTGSGIAPSFLPHVFERFRQGDAGTARKTGGLGLGLSIVRHVVEAHGGEVHAHSDGEGRGATFVARLPLEVAAEQPGVAANVPAFAPAALTGLHVLVVEDDEDTREYLRALLTSCDARVTLASGASEGLAALERERPDVIISDIGMPGEDGFSLMQRVRALPPERGGATPAIALTAFAHAEDRTRAILAGFHNHVPKPMEPRELLAVLSSLGRRGGQNRT